MIKKNEIGIVLLLALLPLLLLPIMKLTGFVVINAWSMNNSMWLDVNITGSLKAYDTLTFNASWTGENISGGYCRVGINLTGSNIQMLNMLNTSLSRWYLEVPINISGNYTYGVECLNNFSMPVNVTGFTLLVRNNTNITVSKPLYMLTGLNISVNVSFMDTADNFLHGADCRINLSQVQMVDTGEVYQFNITYSTNGTKTFNVTCTKEGYSTQNYYGSLDIKNFFDLAQELPGYYESSLALGDYDNDNDWDLFIMGRNTTTNRFLLYYNNNGNDFVSPVYISNASFGSLSLLDYNNDNYLDMFVTGTNGTPLARMYRNNAGSPVDAMLNLVGIVEGSTAIGDINYDGKIDLFYTGDQTGSNLRARKLYINDGTLLLTNNSLDVINAKDLSSNIMCFIGQDTYLISAGDTGTRISEVLNITNIQSVMSNANLIGVRAGTVNCFDYNLDNKLEIFMAGYNNSNTVTSYLYKENQGLFVPERNMFGFQMGSSAFGDLDNDGYGDFALSGSDAAATTPSTKVYLNNQSGEFILLNLSNIVNLGYYSSLALFDYDSDGDLDLIVTGYTSTWTLKTLVYRSNYNLLKTNNPPTPPTDVLLNYTNGKLVINWSTGYDTEQHQDGLYYNIRVGTSSGNYNTISGKYGGSSNPNSGYIGNMQQRRSIELNVPRSSYFVQVQTIDSGLKAGSWSNEANFTVDSCIPPDSGDWIISGVNCEITNNVNLNQQSISIEGNANLSFSGIRLNFSQTSNYEKNITVVDGKLTILNSNISSEYGLDLISEGSADRNKLEISNSRLENVSLRINNSQSIQNSMLDHVEIYSNNTIKHSTINSSLFIMGDGNTLINVSDEAATISGPGSVTSHSYLYFTNPDYLTGINVSIYKNEQYYQSNLTLNGRAVLLLEKYNITTGSINLASNYRLNITMPLKYRNDTLFSLTDNLEISLIIQDGYPDCTGFNNCNYFGTLDLSQLQSMLLNLNITGIGRILFLEPVNIAGINFSSNVSIMNNFIGVNISKWANKRANITLFGKSYTYRPYVLRDGILCTECTVSEYSSNTSFEVSGFSSYETVPNSRILVTYSTNKIVPDAQFGIRVNYSDYATGEFISGTCSIDMQDGNGYSPMLASDNLYTSNYLYSSTGDKYFRVDCSSSTHESLSVLQHVVVTDNRVMFSYNQSLAGVYDEAQVIVNKATNPNYVLITGDTSGSEISRMYNSNLGVITSNPGSLSGSFYGSIGFEDFDNDNKTDIFIAGKSSLKRYEEVSNGTFSEDVNFLSGTISYLHAYYTILDYNNDGKSDLILCSYNDDYTNVTKSYKNTGSDLVEDTNQNIIQTKDCRLGNLDYNQDGYMDLFITGYSNNGPIAKIYRNNNGLFVDSGITFNGTYWSAISIADFDNNGFTDILYFGCNETPYATSCRNLSKGWYKNNNGVFSLDYNNITNLQPLFINSLAYGDYNNDGNIDLFTTGIPYTRNSNSGISISYLNNNSNIVRDLQNNIANSSYGSSILSDIDNDTDLDLIVTGIERGGSEITKIYTSDQSLISPNTKPSAPANVNLSYNDNTIILNWSRGSDTETPTLGLYYNIRIGSKENENEFYSGITPMTSSPNQGMLGNVMQTRYWRFNISTNKCIVAEVQTIDTGLLRSDYSTAVNVSFIEICDGFDNDCDGVIDNGCDKDLDHYVDKNMNCSVQWWDNTVLIIKSCPSSVGDDCNDSNSSIYPSASEKCGNGIDEDCNGADATCQVGGGGGGGSSTGDQQLNPEEQEDRQEFEDTQNEWINNLGSDSDDDKKEVPPSVEQPKVSDGSSNNPAEEIVKNVIESSIQMQWKFETGANGKTTAIYSVKNLGLFDREVNITTTFPKDIIQDASKIIQDSKSPFDILEWDPKISFYAVIPSFNEMYKKYSLDKPLNEEQKNEIIVELLTDLVKDKKLEEEFLKKVNETAGVTNVTQTFIIDTENNRTIITIDIQINETASLYNVSVFQEIPKCLVEIINKQMIESKNKDFEIINADPLIVWHFENMLDAKQIQFAIKAVADENCTNQIKAMAVAKNINIFNKEINYVNLWISVSIIPIIALILILFGMFCTKVEHEDEDIRRLTDYVRQMYRNGFGKEQIKQRLLEEKYPLKEVEQCLELHTESRFHYWIHRLEIGFEEIVLIFLILFNLAEFFEYLPGDLNYLQKVMSIVVIGYLMYRVSVTEVLFGTRHKVADFFLIFAFTVLTLKNMLALAKASFYDANFAQDLYAYIISHNLLFSRHLFIASIIIILIVSIYLALRAEIKAPSLVTAMHVKEGKTESLFQFFRRLIIIHIALLAFFTIIFNLMMEWLGIVIDSFITMMILIIMIVLIIKHWKKFNFGKFVEDTSNASEEFYEKFISLFHYKKTIYLGISGMLILHSLTEIGNFIVPYITGLRVDEGDIYFSALSGHMPIFSLYGESLFGLQTSAYSILQKVLVGLVYAMNVIALLMLLLLPALVWLNYYRHRNLPILETLQFKITNSKMINSIIFGIFISSLILFVAKPAFSLASLPGSELAGVDILTNQVNIDYLVETVVISLVAGVLAAITALFFNGVINITMLPPTFVFFSYYIYLFARSVTNNAFSNFSLLSTHNSLLVAFYSLFIGIISLVVLYCLGYLIIAYLYMPARLKLFMHDMPLLNKIFKGHHLHHIHYHDSHDNLQHGEKEETIKNYVIKSLDSGHELFYIVEHLVEHHWPIDLIEKSLADVEHDKLFEEEVKHVVHYHHKPENIARLAEWIKGMYSEHNMKDIIKVAMENKWTEDDIILAFKHLGKGLKVRQEDAEIMKYMYIVH